MRLARNIYNDEGLVLLGEHVELTETMIRRLEQLGIHRIYIEDPRAEDIVIRENISEEMRREALRTIRENFQNYMNEAKQGRMFCNPHLGKDFRRVLDMIIDELKEHKQAMIMLNTIHVSDHYLFQHSLNVCIYAIMLGTALGYTYDQLRVLGLGAMLHDIGKTLVPQEILLKRDKLTKEEMSIIRRHPEDGFRMLKDNPNISLIAAHCALQHHERLDGSGYPRGIKGDEIHEYAKLLGIVDTFDAMTTHRVYKPAALPHEAVEVLYAGAGRLYDAHMIQLFRDRVAIYPPGTTVELNTGEIGIVVDINASLPHRPVVRIITDENGKELKEPYEIDMSKKLNIVIIKVNENF
ncbi:HD-GYP domain-containing protein [Insulibacter thermoxylanivorax]|nr:HD-GYP domain-containing protein [Insulibacter thermoxylanivorax]